MFLRRADRLEPGVMIRLPDRGTRFVQTTKQDGDRLKIELVHGIDSAERVTVVLYPDDLVELTF